MADHRFLGDNGCLFDECIPIPPTPSFVPDTIYIDVHHQSRLRRNLFVAAGCLLALSFFLLLFYSLLRRRRRRRRDTRLLQQQQAPPPDAVGGADLLVLDDGDLPDDGPHHVWYIRTVGLDESVIKSIAAVVYKSGDGFVGAEDCTVCLGEFEDGEVVKLLPKCSHAFHLSCIDTWLRSHVNCPLCRAPVVAPAAAEKAESAQTESPQQEHEIAIELGLTAGASSSSGPLGEEKDGDEVQPIRRSVSMDSSSLGMLMLRVESEPEEKSGEERKELELRDVVISKNRGKGIDSSAKQIGVEMKRSLSTRSGRFFFSRYRRGRSISVLPF